MSQYQQQLRAIAISLNLSENKILGKVINFKQATPKFTIAREKLIVKLNTALRMPPEVIKPTPKVTHESDEVIIGNETGLNKNITTNKKKVSQMNIMHN